ncbi:MAG: VWA domain-containing protein [Pirellulales bacterium]
MDVLHPWALGIGAAASAAPLAIHVLTRPRAVRMPLSTIQFVLEVVQARSRLNRLRDWLVLLLRSLAVALLALALARPLWHAAPSVVPGGESTVARVVILDVSHSMAAQTGGVQVFERARSLAADYLKPQRHLHGNIILAGARPVAVFDRAVPNLASLQSELAQAAVKPERLNAQAAIDLAVESLRRNTTAETTRELVVVSDFQRANWSTADLATVPADIEVELRSARSHQVVPNLGLLGVRCVGRADRHVAARLELDVGNFSSVPREVAAELRLGSSTVRFQGLCAPRGTTTLTATWTPGDVGWFHGQARLLDVDDALVADNNSAFAVFVHAPPTYLLLTRQPENLMPSASYFLERALVPEQATPTDPRERVVRASIDKVDRERLLSADLLVVDHPGKLREDVIQTIVGLLRRGCGLLYVAADSIDAENLAALARVAGRDWQAAVAYAAPPANKPRRGLFLVQLRQNQPPFRVFGDDALSAVSPLRFAGGLDTQLTRGAVNEEILATFGDQSVFLMLTTCGAGSLAVLNADLGATNLTAEPADWRARQTADRSRVDQHAGILWRVQCAIPAHSGRAARRARYRTARGEHGHEHLQHRKCRRGVALARSQRAGHLRSSATRQTGLCAGREHSAAGMRSRRARA